MFRTGGLWEPPRAMDSFIPEVYLHESQIRHLGLAVR